MTINMNHFIKKYNEEYNRLYSINDCVAGFDEAVKAFDEFNNALDSMGYNNKANQKLYTLLILDFDLTYDNEPEDELGVSPSVYLIPLDKQIEVEKLASRAHDMFHSSHDIFLSIGDIFEDLMKANRIKYQYVGSLEIPFGERQVDYLADYLPLVVV